MERVSEQLKKLTVKIIVSEHKGVETKNLGSGVLHFFDNDKGYTYVFTAKHCIYGRHNELKNTTEEDVKVKYKNNDNDRFVYFTVHRIIPTNDDFALLQLAESEVKKHIPQPPQISILNDTVEQNNYEYRFRGYPKWLNGKTHVFTNTFIENVKPNFKIKCEDSLLDSSGDTVIEKIEGLSGSGVFIKIGKKIYLIGVVTDLLNPHGTFHTFICFGLWGINEILKNEHLPYFSIVKKEEILSAKELNSVLNDSSWRDLIDEGDKQFKQKNYDYARICYETADNKGRRYMKENQKKRLLRKINQCTTEPIYEDNLKKAKRELNKGNFTRALEYAQTAKKASNKKEIRALIKEIEKKVERQSFENACNTGDILFKQEKYTNSLNKYKEAFKLNTSTLLEKKILTCEACILFQKDALEPAKSSFTKALSVSCVETSETSYLDNFISNLINTCHYQINLQKGDAYKKKYQKSLNLIALKNALSHYQNAIQFNPNDNHVQQLIEYCNKRIILFKFSLCFLLIITILYFSFCCYQSQQEKIKKRSDLLSQARVCEAQLIPFEEDESLKNLVPLDKAIYFYSQIVPYKKEALVEDNLQRLKQLKARYRTQVNDRLKYKKNRDRMEEDFSEGLKLIKYNINKKFGYIDRTNSIVIMPKYEYLPTTDKEIFFHKTQFHKLPIAKVKLNNHCFYINTKDELVKECDCYR